MIDDLIALAELGAVTICSDEKGFKVSCERLVNDKRYGLGFIVTRHEFDQSGDVFERRAKQLLRSMKLVESYAA